MVGILEAVVGILMTIAGLLGSVAHSLPEGIPTTVPPLCVQLPVDNLQAGYCP